MLEDALVLLQREGERFVLRPITPPSQHTYLSPLIKWYVPHTVHPRATSTLLGSCSLSHATLHWFLLLIHF